MCKKKSRVYPREGFINPQPPPLAIKNVHTKQSKSNVNYVSNKEVTRFKMHTLICTLLREGGGSKNHFLGKSQKVFTKTA